MSRKKKVEFAEVCIESIQTSGYGVGKFKKKDGTCIDVEIPHTYPGDKVEVQLGRRRRGALQGRFPTLKEEASGRVKPRCVHFTACGGCRWQHLSYEEQLGWKLGWLNRWFSEVIQDRDIHIQPIIPCDDPWHYRNKMEFTFSENSKGTRYLGLHRPAQVGMVEDLTECWLSPPWFTDLLVGLRSWWESTGLKAYFPRTNRGSLRTVTVRQGFRTGDRLVMLTVSGHPDDALSKEQIDGFVEAVKQSCTEEERAQLSIFIRVHQAIKGQPTQFFEMHLFGSEWMREVLYADKGEGEKKPFTFYVSPTAFFQPNTLQAEKIYNAVLRCIIEKQALRVLDLYCGTGTMTLFAGYCAQEAIGIELHPESILDAEENLKESGQKNVTFYQGDVGDVLGKLRQEKSWKNPDLVIIDPPRAGLDDRALELLGRIKSPYIVYVSCNPKTQVENIKVLQDSGYRIESVQPVDQFPHTVHMENIVLLSREF